MSAAPGGELEDRPPTRSPDSDVSIADELAAWGKVILLETRGRVTGRTATAAVGFVVEPDGAVLIAAGDANADWALNLTAHPGCRIRLEEAVTERVAVPLDGDDHHRAVVALILKYGTPAERLGAGPAFRLLPGTPAPRGG